MRGGVELTIGSLFSGIGGLELGLERAGLGPVIWQAESDPYARRVLAKRWPGVKCYDDVREIDAERPDIICGGFPCQDISLAGKQVGIDGERSGLWGEFARVLRVLRPRVAVIENVPALLANGFDRVLRDLHESGFDAEWDCIPASAFGAHFQGDRVFIVATSSETNCVRLQGGWQPPNETNTWGRREFERLVRVETEHGVPAGSLGRISDGVSQRSHRLRCLGNAVVPQVAEHIGRLIAEQT